MLETERQSAAKSKVHFGKVQRLPEGFSPLNNRFKRPAPSMKGEDIVHTSTVDFFLLITSKSNSPTETT